MPYRVVRQNTMRNYDNSELTPAHLAEDDRVRVTYNSAYSDKRQSFEGTVTNIGGALGPVTIDPHEDMDDGEPRIYILDSDVSVDTGYGDRRISDMTNPDIVIELLEESDEAESAEALIHAEKGDVITLTYESTHDNAGRVRKTVEVLDEPYRFDTPDAYYKAAELQARDRGRADDADPFVELYARVSHGSDPDDTNSHFSGYASKPYDRYQEYRKLGTDLRVENVTPAEDADDTETDAESEPAVRTDGGFDELLDASADANATHDATLTRDEVAALDDETPVTLAYETTQRTEKTITATVDRAWDGAYFAIAFLTTADDKERTLHVYKSGRGTLYCEHDAPAGGQRLSQLSRAYIVRPEPEPVTDGGRREYPEPRDYRDLIESEETPKPLAEGEHVESDNGVRMARLEGAHSEEFCVSAGGINTVVMDRDEIALYAELAGFEVSER